MIKINKGEVKFKTFPNGEITVDLESLANIDLYRLDNRIIFKYENDSDLIKLMILKKYLDQFKETYSLIITYMPYSRMDRTEHGVPFTLKYISEFINSLKFTKVFIVEPHSDVTMALIENAEQVYMNEYLLPSVKNFIGFDDKLDYLFFPDAGAQKRYLSLSSENQMVGFKKRNFMTGEIESLEVIGFKDPAPSIKKVLIVDDLSSYGGTFYHSGSKLKELGFEEIYLLVTHAENSIFHGKLFDDDSPIKTIFTTDTILSDFQTAEKYQNEDKLELYKIGETIK